jgi:hypothetical protein
MKEEFVSFKTARLAKEKGFDQPTRKYYQISLTESVHPEDGTTGPFGWEKGELSIQDGYFINNYKGSDTTNDSWFLCACPTQSFLQKWLREKHGIDVQSYFIEYRSNGRLIELKPEDRTYSYRIYKNGLDHFVWTSEPEFDSYEDALEEGLHEALKIIQ